MANVITGYTTNATSDPQFDFFISGGDWFINTPGFSINLSEKSYSTYDDGKFSILNTNSIPLYFGGLVFNNARLRTDVSGLNKTLTVVSQGTTGTTTNIYESFNVSYRGNLLGILTLEYPIDYYESGKVIMPYQSVKFSAIYKVENLNKVNLQYFGSTTRSKDKKVGLLDFNFILRSYKSGENDSSNLIEEPITISCYVVNTGYIPEVLVAEPLYYTVNPDYI